MSKRTSLIFSGTAALSARPKQPAATRHTPSEQRRQTVIHADRIQALRAASDLRFQRKSDAQRDLVVANRPILDMAARLHDLEPLHIANGLGRAPDGVLDRVVNRFFRR